MKSKLLFLFTLLCHSVFAQIASFESISISNSIQESINKSAVYSDTIFSETFGNGLNGDANNGNWTTYGSPVCAQWEYRGSLSFPDNTLGSRGAYSNTLGPILSATAQNGFMIYDFDYLDNAGIPGNFGNGPCPNLTDGYLESPSINLSAYGSSVIQLTGFFRRFSAEAILEMSNDNGLTWQSYFSVYPSNIIHTITANPEQTTIEIPPAFLNSTQFKFRLGFITSITSTQSGYYFWQVDDIYILEKPDNDIRADLLYFNGSSDSNSYHFHYEKVPVLQAQKDTQLLGIQFTNKGKAIQHNIKTKAHIEGNTTTTIVSTATLSSLAVNQTDAQDIGNFIPPPIVDDYTYKLFAESDSADNIPDNDTLKYSYSASKNIYQWTSTQNIAYKAINTNDSYELCNLFKFYSTDTIVAIGCQFYYQSNDPYVLQADIDSLEFSILDASQFDASNQYTGNILGSYENGQNSIYKVRPYDVQNYFHVPLSSNGAPVIVSPGEYWACIKSYNENTFIRANQKLSEGNGKAGIAISRADNSPQWDSAMITTSMQLVTKGGNNACQNVQFSLSHTKDESTHNNGSINLQTAGGHPGYTYHWEFPDNTQHILSDSIIGLNLSGDYTVIVEDAFGCKSSPYTVNLGGCVGLKLNNIFSVDSTQGNLQLQTSGGTGSYSYTWSALNNTNFSSTSSTLNNLSSDIYFVTVTDDNCPTVTTTLKIPVFLVSIDAHDHSSIWSFYPNPAQQKLYIKTSIGIDKSIQLYNLNGQLILSKEIDNQEGIIPIDIEHLAKGVYYLIYQQRNQSREIKKLVIN